jgi:hypothetical protein
VVTRHKEKIETLLEEERALSRHTKNGFWIHIKSLLFHIFYLFRALRAYWPCWKRERTPDERTGSTQSNGLFFFTYKILPIFNKIRLIKRAQFRSVYRTFTLSFLHHFAVWKLYRYSLLRFKIFKRNVTFHEL